MKEAKIINTITIAISLPPVNIQNVGTTVDASPEKRRKEIVPTKKIIDAASKAQREK